MKGVFSRFKDKVMHLLPEVMLWSFVIIVAAGLYDCPANAMFGISCPGCGMTEAMVELVHLDICAAFKAHCLFPLCFFWAGYCVIRRKISFSKRLDTVLLLITVLLFLVRWILILIFK